MIRQDVASITLHAGVYLGNDRGGNFVARKAHRDFDHAPFSAQESEVLRTYCNIKEII